MKQENKQRLGDMCFAAMHNEVVAEGFGGGEYGKKWPSIFTALNSICLWTVCMMRNPLAKPVPIRSSLIKPNQAQSSHL